MAQPTALEQYLLEHVNAERAQAGVQPLASNSALDQAAESHSQWMIDTDTFSHSGAGGSDPGARMTAAGYAFNPSTWANGENIAWVSTRAPDGYQDEVDLLHANLMNSPGHRENLLNGDFKEVGLGLKVGEFQGWQGAFVTEDFARSGTGSFLTGVAYTDKDGDHAYDPGEGLGGLTVDAVNAAGTHFTTTTLDAGGYNLPLTPGSYSVTFENGSAETAAQSITIGSSSVKVDVVNPGFTTASPTPSDPLPTPGSTPDPVQAPTGQTITGTRYADSLVGSAGNDAIQGAGGRDSITGAGGDDHLWGGTGSDTFVFKAGFGHDTIEDFRAGSSSGHDYIDFSSDVFSSFSAVMSHTTDTPDGALITYDDGNSVLLSHVQKSSLVAWDFHFF